MENSLDSQNSLKSIFELKGYEFNIPSYQRGYRWSKMEVEALLVDLLDFQEQNTKSFYCLQPVVVNKAGDIYNVIDGQQRLTTIFLIIKYLQNENFFSLSYETRKESKDFLSNIQAKRDVDANNMDFYHIFKAYKTIKAFFENKAQIQESFKDTLLDRCKVLWYEITQNQTENEVFVRLNIGKIPLLPAENVKALFLAKNEDLKDDTLIERADFWYEAEKKARENRDFRYCVLSKIHREDIQKNKTSDKPELKDDILRIEAYLKALSGRGDMFRYFYKHYKQKSINEEWDNLETCINVLGSFASNTKQEKLDREIFHYLGFLIFNGENLADIYQRLWLEKARKNKETFKEVLFEKIKNKMSESITNIEELNYLESEDRLNIKSLLLLFNLEYLNRQEESNEYFKFNRFALEEWSLEHIYAQNSKSIATAIKELDKEAIKKWLKEVLQHLNPDEDKAMKDKIEKILESQTLQKEEIDDITKTLDDHFFNQTKLHAISNLTLLDKSSNSKIGNLIFSQKRLAIQKLAEEDRLIPIATKKVFNKEFSKEKNDPNVFTEDDQRDYLNHIKKLLKNYGA